MVKLSNKQWEKEQSRRLDKLEKRANNDDKVIARLEKRIIALENRKKLKKAKKK